MSFCDHVGYLFQRLRASRNFGRRRVAYDLWAIFAVADRSSKDRGILDLDVLQRSRIPVGESDFMEFDFSIIANITFRDLSAVVFHTQAGIFHVSARQTQ